VQSQHCRGKREGERGRLGEMEGEEERKGEGRENSANKFKDT
jgi:hypothetical protein